MARPERNNVDYFPFICNEGKGMFFIEQKYGNDGYATWIKLLRELAMADYHFLNMNDEVYFMYLTAKCRVDKDVLINIINDLVLLGEFDNELWNNNKVIFNEKFIKNIKDAYSKRSNECVDKVSLIEVLIDLNIVDTSKLHRKHIRSCENSTVNTHTILDYTIEDNIIEDNVTASLFKDEEVTKEKAVKKPKDYRFNEFWDSYHKITKLPKTDLAESKKYWVSLSVEDKEKAIEKIKLYSDSIEDKKFVRKARTYLSKRNFDDEFAKTTTVEVSETYDPKMVY